MELYPYSSAFIINDNTYVAYGGHTGTSTAAQRNAAYLIAEKQMSSHLGTFLKPTIVTGTFPWPNGYHLVLPYSFIISIPSVTVYNQESYCNCDLEDYEGCAFIFSDTYGYIDVRKVASGVNACACVVEPPYTLQVVMNVGLPTGTSTQADMLLALTIASEINLYRIIDPSANEGVGDVGISEFSNQDYRETRTGLRRTIFGVSARANEVANLVATLRRRRALKF